MRLSGLSPASQQPRVLAVDAAFQKQQALHVLVKWLVFEVVLLVLTLSIAQFPLLSI